MLTTKEIKVTNDKIIASSLCKIKILWKAFRVFLKCSLADFSSVNKIFLSDP
jgi:hypothetical protein